MRLRLTAALLCAATLAGAGAAPASAHPMHTSEVLLGVQSGRVAGQIRLPVDRLAVVLHGAPTPAAVQRYVRARIGAAGADGRRWRIAVGGAHAATVDGVRDLVLPLVLTPADGKVTDFTLRYDVIIDRLVTHKAIATMGGKLLGVFDWDTKALGVHAGGGSWLQGFLSAVRLGVQHIGTGADHLLFLLMLLVPAPLVARRGRWRRSDDPRRSALRVVHVVSAFALGHSLTLALASLGVVHVPAQLVECLIALSILVSAIHALRPLIPGGEALIGFGFGLVHGLAFATLLGTLGLSGGALVSSLFGFNLGIELTQLLVVALLMPSLYLLSRTGAYGVLRVGLALAGVVLAGAWLLERSGLIGADPLDGVTNALIAHPFVVAGAFALAAAAGRYGPLAEHTAITVLTAFRPRRRREYQE